MHVLNRRDISELLKVPVSTVNYLVQTGQIPFFRIGKRSVRFDAERIKVWISESEGRLYRLKRG